MQNLILHVQIEQDFPYPVGAEARANLLITGTNSLRPCLHGVGDPGLVGLVSFVFTLWGTQNKRNLPH